MRHLNNEQQLTDRLIEVSYDFTKSGTRYQGRGVLVSSTDSKALIFDNGFLEVHKEDHIRKLVPYRTTRQLQTVELSFTGISFDSLQRLLRNKPITALKLEASLSIRYQKDKRPESGTSISLEHVYNPVLRCSEVDSVDLAVKKELDLLGIELLENGRLQKEYTLDKANLETYLVILEEKLHSSDLAERECAVNEYKVAKRKLEQMRQPIDRHVAIRLKIKYLQQRLIVSKPQSISGYMSYLEF